ncbi:GPI inositol-deacylase, partial [Tremellales sp. Uapishka_1]
MVQHLPAWLLLAFATVVSLAVFCSFRQDQQISGTYGCEMSWMTPSYTRIQKGELHKTKYALYLYREQGWDTLDEPSGHPVIFIPGNAGSYQQVRSIASSASRQFYSHAGGHRAGDMDGAMTLDFFALDLNEDFSAFHAATLREQAEYTAESIRRVLSLYDHLPAHRRPRQVTILGHSMGGVVARLAMTLGVDHLIDVVFTLSTPHALPPLTFEYGMESIYRSISAYRLNASRPLLFSLCGGVSDTQIVSDTCVLGEEVVGPSDGFAVFTTGISGVWTGVEHQTMVWCHQIRWTVARALLEMSKSQDREAKLLAADRWLLRGTLPKSIVSPRHREAFELPVTSSRMTIIVHDENEVTLDDTIRWCDVDGSCEDITPAIQAFPAPREETAPFPFPGEGVKSGEVAYALDFELPKPQGILSLRGTRPEAVTAGSHEDYVSTDNAWTSTAASPFAPHLTINFAKVLTSSLLVRRLRVEIPSCRGGRRPWILHSSIPTSPLASTTHESRFYRANATAKDIYLHSHVGGAPFMAGQATSLGMTIDIFQSPGCEIRGLHSSIDIGASLSKVVIRYRMAAIAWMLGWTAIIIRCQLSFYERSATIPPIHLVLREMARKDVWRTIVLLTGAGALQVISLPSLRPHDLLLGTTQLALMPLQPVLALWSLGIVVAVWLVVGLLARCGARLCAAAGFATPSSR